VTTYDVAVIGGGPAGYGAARDIAAERRRVLVLEEHEQAGEPLQCSGLVSPHTLELAGVSNSVVLNRLKGAIVYAPSGNTLKLKGNRTLALAIDRPAFERELYRQALEAGVEVSFSTRITGLEDTPGALKIISNNLENGIKAHLVIGADGANSAVARCRGLFLPGEVITMYAAEVYLPSRETELAEIYLGNQLAPGWFGWVIPLDQNHARVGIGSARKSTSASSCFQLLLKTYPERFKELKIIKPTGGIVVLGFHSRTYGPRVMLVGDAARQNKPLSGGGLHPGLKAARCCAQVALQALAKGDFSEKMLSRYQTMWEKEIGHEIKHGLKNRKIFASLSDSRMELIIRFLNRPFWKSLILNQANLDQTAKLAGRLVTLISRF